MSYPQHPSPAGGALAASNPGVIRSQNPPYIPSQPFPMAGMPLPPHGQHSHPHQQLGFPPQHQLPYPHNPSQQRPIASLPSHARQMHNPNMPSLRPQNTSSRSHTGRAPYGGADPSASFKRVKVVGDAYEASYLIPGPSNRILLSLKSGLPVQIDWALSRLVSLTANHRDHAARDFTLDSIPGLSDALLSYVRRIHAALTGQPPSKWSTAYYEQPSQARDVGIGAPGDTGHQGTSTLQQTSISSSHTALKSLAKGHVPAQAKHSSSTDLAADTFHPSHDPSHADLMRRALEAALALRNLATHSSNARHLAAVKGIFAIIRDILQLPLTAVNTSGHSSTVQRESQLEHEDAWLEIQGIQELRLYFLDIFEVLAAKVLLTRRAASKPPNSKALPLVNGHSAASDPSQLTKDDASPGDDIFASLVSMALQSSDRALLLGSLRSLATMAAIENNEAAFVEVTLPDGQQSPGLLQRCVELLPLTQDTELLEAVLDLLYQLVCIGNNAIKVTAALDTEVRVSLSPRSSSAHANNVRAASKSAALVRLLSRNLQLGRTMWERSMPLKVPQEWLSSVPSRQVEEMRRKRELKFRIANESPRERAKRKKLTRQERRSLLGLTEPDRGIAWMKLVFQRNPDKEVTQMEFWTAYKEEFSQQSDGVPLQPAAELIRAVSQVFPQAAAMVVTSPDGKPQRFVIKGIDVRERDIDMLEPYHCHWSTCPSPETDSVEAQKSHAKLHVQYAPDSRCRWRRCNFDAKASGIASVDKDEQKRVLLAHVLTHIRSEDSKSAPIKSPARPSIVVDDDLRVVSGATHTGEAAQLITGKAANGARVLRGKRDPDGVEIRFTMDKAAAGSANGMAHGTGHGPVAPTNATPSSGTLDNPGSYSFDVTRTPSSGNDDSLSPQGPAFTSILILRMLTRRAASLLLKAGSKGSDEDEDEVDAAAIQGQGDEKFGLPLPANFGASERTKRTEDGEKDTQVSNEAGGMSMLSGGEVDYDTTEKWAVDAATRLLDAIEGVEEDLMQHSSQNDILSSYINETLMELRRRPTRVGQGSTNGQVDPDILREDASFSLM